MVAVQAADPLEEAVREEIWTPRRQDIIWIDRNPQVGQEMRDVHPFLVLSPRAFNAKTSLVMGLPMTTEAYNADNPFAVAVGALPRATAEKPATFSAINPNPLTGACAKQNRIPWENCRIRCSKPCASV